MGAAEANWFSSSAAAAAEFLYRGNKVIVWGWEKVMGGMAAGVGEGQEQRQRRV